MTTPANTTHAPAAVAPAANVITKEEPKTFKELLLMDGYKNALAQALPKHITADRMIRVVLTAMNRQPKLLQCTKESLWQAVMDCAAIGLEPNPLGHAYIIPYRNKVKDASGREVFVMQAQFQAGYRGFADLLYRSGMVESCQAQVVYSQDLFEFEYGMGESLRHRPAQGDRGEPIGAYAYCRLKGGAFHCDYMSVTDIERIRRRSKSADNGPWVTDWDEMARKTPFKRMCKYLPLSTELRDAIAKDDENDGDLAVIAGDAVTARLTDDFGSDPAKVAEQLPQVDPKLEECLTRVMGNGLSGDACLGILATHSRKSVGTIAELSAQVPAEKVAKCIDDLTAAMHAGA